MKRKETSAAKANAKEFTRKNESMDEPIDYFISNE